MSTKRLERTVIEGGRRNKWERRYSHAEERAHLRNYITEVKADPENWYDYDIEPIEPVYKAFSDKLSPMYRWLHAQAGRPWNDVRSEVAEKFDTRTTAGRHIVHDHLLNNVEVTPDLRYGRYYYGPEDYTTSYSKNDFYVDEEGILRAKTHISRKHKLPKFNTNNLCNWLNGRVPGYVGDRLYWFVPTTGSKKIGGKRNRWTNLWGSRGYPWYYYDRSLLRFLYLYETPIQAKDEKGMPLFDVHGRMVVDHFKQEWKDANPSFRQDRKLTPEEYKYWEKLPEYYQKEIIKWSPTYVETEEEKAKRLKYYRF